MKKSLFVAFICIICLITLNFCKTDNHIDVSVIAKDSVSIAHGKSLFNQHCVVCHSFRQAGIGPHLGGITQDMSANWIMEFIRNPKKMIDAGDKRAVQSYDKFKSYMIPFAFLSDTALNSIVAYLHTQGKPMFKSISDTLMPLLNPWSDTIPMSDLIVDLKLITQLPPSDTTKALLTRITKMDVEPNSKNLFLLDLRGKLYRLFNDRVTTYMDMSLLKPKFIHRPGLATGFGSFAFHPEFNKNGLLYTTHTEPPGSDTADFKYHDSIRVMLQWVLTEWKTNTPSAQNFSGQSREIMRINVESVIHGMQEIIFNPNAKKGTEDYGLLYIGLGDGGAVEHGFPFLAHDLTRIWGNVLRIDPLGKNVGSLISMNQQYGIPASNPFIHLRDSGALGEIYARGFRNPHRITWTSNGKMLVSNIGHFNIESLNLILAGHDYGWPVTEGPFMIDVFGDMKKVYKLPANYNKYNFTYPVAAYDHDEGLAICGGYEYQGKTIPVLNSKFMFGDIVRGRLFYVNTSDIELGKTAPIYEGRLRIDGVIKTLKQLCGCNKVDLHFGRDALGELYIMTKPDGKLYKMVNAVE